MEELEDGEEEEEEEEKEDDTEDFGIQHAEKEIEDTTR